MPLADCLIKNGIDKGSIETKELKKLVKKFRSKKGGGFNIDDAEIKAVKTWIKGLNKDRVDIEEQIKSSTAKG